VLEKALIKTGGNFSNITLFAIDVQGCTNALKGRMPVKGHPEHKKG
jgi:hypothetical protein